MELNHTQESLSKLKLAELKAICKEKKLAVSGTKAELTNRILGLDAPPTATPKTTKSNVKKQKTTNELQKPVFSHLAKQAQHFVIKRNIHGNFEHLETHLVFSMDKKVIGVQEESGKIRELNVSDLENVNRYHFELDKSVRINEVQATEDNLSNTEEMDNKRFEELVSIIQ
jgi:restriction endonuclease Mrr